MNNCAQCGMLCLSNEYHPYAACMMFELCRNGSVVRKNLSAVVDTALKGTVYIFTNTEPRVVLRKFDIDVKEKAV